MSLPKTFYNFFLYVLDFFVQCFLLITIILCCNNLVQITFQHIVLFLVQLIIWYFIAYIQGLYDEIRSPDFISELKIITKIFFTQFFSLVMIFFVFQVSDINKIFIILYPISVLIITTIIRYILRKFIKYFYTKTNSLRSILIIGANNIGFNFYKKIIENPQFGYRFIGFLGDRLNEHSLEKYIGPISKLEEVLSNEIVNEVIIALPNDEYNKLEHIISVCSGFSTRVKILPDYFNFISEDFEIIKIGNFPLISLIKEKLSKPHWRLLKRIFDLIFSLFIIIFIFSWLFPIISFLIKIDSKGPIFFKQERWGKDNKIFYIYKFRTMTKDSRDVDKNGNFLQAQKNDSRITRVGKFLRKTNIDELPQFINVLKNEMSVVGPRPHPTPLNLISKDKVRNYILRHLVKPGVTGMAQVNGARGETDTISKMQRRIDYDVWYINNWSIWLDMKIIFLTIWKTFTGDKHAF